MPNRILKESICTSDSIAILSWFEEILFYRLIVNCDDYGRFDGRTAVIKNRLFPLKDSITAKSVDTAINNLVRAGLVALYEFEGKPYLYLPSWNEHQNVRAKRSRYPAPENSVNTSAYICKQMHADVPVIQSNPIQSESLSESKSMRTRAAFQKPTLQELTAYCQENSLKIDPQMFLDYYESNGWMVGKTKMKDWRATARHWARKDFNRSMKKTESSPASYDIDEFDRRGFNIPKLD